MDTPLICACDPMLCSIRVSLGLALFMSSAPLHLAVTGDYVRCESLLLDHAVIREDCFFKTNLKGQTALDLARAQSKIESIEYLEREQFKLMEAMPPDADRFPLHSAAYHGDGAEVRAILEGSAVPEHLVLVQDDGGSTALHKAGGNGRLRCIEVLLRYAPKRQKRMRNFKAQTAYDAAIAYSQFRAARLIGPNDQYVDVFADLDMDNEEGTDEVHEKVESEVDIQDRMVERYFDLYGRYEMIKNKYRECGGKLPEDEQHDSTMSEIERLARAANDRVQATMIEIEKVKAEMDLSKQTILKLVIKGKFPVDKELKAVLNL